MHPTQQTLSLFSHHRHRRRPRCRSLAICPRYRPDNDSKRNERDTSGGHGLLLFIPAFSPPSQTSTEDKKVTDEGTSEGVGIIPRWRRWRRRRWGRRDRSDRVDPEELESEREPISPSAVAVEYVRNGKREFFVKGDRKQNGEDGLKVLESKSKYKRWGGRAMDRFLRYFLPAGYPETITQNYPEYTKWRLLSFFFGGSIGVFATQNLLLAVGVGRKSAAPVAAALQWVVRDGIGRSGRMFFSQIGRGFDAETKQYRLAAAFVLNMSCAIEAITPLLPNLFLPLACLANMAKGASTVAAASTRGAIYRSFMSEGQENLGDITAKQETVGVAGDLVGTAVGICLSRFTAHSRKLTTAAFAFVSLAHLLSVYREIGAIQLGTLNRQRAHMLIKSYLSEGQVPDLARGNRNERILNRPWLDSLHAPNIDLGARLVHCAPDAEALQYLLRMYRKEKYIFTYEDTRLKIVLRNDAKSHDCLKAFLQADYFWNQYKKVGVREDRNRALVEESYKFANKNFESFVREADRKGWKTESVLLRPIGRRAAWGPALTTVRTGAS